MNLHYHQSQVVDHEDYTEYVFPLLSSFIQTANPLCTVCVFDASAMSLWNDSSAVALPGRLHYPFLHSTTELDSDISFLRNVHSPE